MNAKVEKILTGTVFAAFTKIPNYEILTEVVFKFVGLLYQIKGILLKPKICRRFYVFPQPDKNKWFMAISFAENLQ